MLPPQRHVYAAVATELSIPVHSRHVGGAWDSCSMISSCEGVPAPNSLRMLIAFSSGAVSRWYWYVRTVGTRFRANSRRFGSISVMEIGWAPLARAARRATKPIGPAPWIETPLPISSSIFLRACRMMLSGSRSAACEKDIESGSLWIHSAA